MNKSWRMLRATPGPLIPTDNIIGAPCELDALKKWAQLTNGLVYSSVHGGRECRPCVLCERDIWYCAEEDDEEQVAE